MRRRDLAAALLGGPLLAQTTPPKLTVEEELRAAQDRLRRAGDALAKAEVPMSKEPAFVFRVY